MQRFPPLLLVLLASVLFAYPAKAHERTAPVWLVSNGLHTSVAIRTMDLPRPLAREILTDRGARIALIGWGAHDYYRAHINPWTVAKAVVGRSGSLIHVVPIRHRIQDRFPRSDIIRLDLPRSAVRQIVAEIDRSFARDSRGRPRLFSRGYYEDTRFFVGRDRFYLAHNCNVWLAQKLRRAGVPVRVTYCVIAPCLIAETAKFGTRESHRGRPSDGY